MRRGPGVIRERKMADEQTPKRVSGRGPRPVPALRAALGLPVGGARRRAPPSAPALERETPSDLSKGSSLEPGGSSHERQAARLRIPSSPSKLSNDGNLRQSTHLAEGIEAKPAGPDYVVMRPIIAAALGLNEQRRAHWRKTNVELPDEMKEEDKAALLRGEGRVRVASPETRKAYLSRGLRMIDRYRRETATGVSMEDIDPRLFVDWLLGLKPHLKDDTWRGYRASAAAVLGSIPVDHMDEAIAMLHADLQVGADEGRRAFRSNKDSDRDAADALPYAKRIEYRHFEDLKRSLPVMSRSKVAEWLHDWLVAGICTGLRPMEWAFTDVEKRDGRVWLHVISAKAADGRATHRTLDLSNFSPETLQAVERMVERSRGWVLTGRMAMHQGEVAKLLRQTCKVLFPRMQMEYTLYSPRHQFIANMKTIYPREEVAAMADYGSTDTQVEHYAKRRAAWTGQQITEVPRPVQEQVSRIKRSHEFFDERRAIKAMKEAARRRAE
jgi:hypothetical protein